jgi:hypothetical protein
VSYDPTAITSLASGYVPFAGAKPIKSLWVSPTGNDRNSGSDAAHAFKTISAAMAKADPGTAVMVKAGTYTDSVRMKSGAADKPVWLVSADGESAAKIKAPSADLPVIYGFGNDNMVIKGFEIIGGMDGIKFTQGGHRLVNLADNIVIQDNDIHGQRVDGIKVAQARNAVVVGNTIHDIKGADEAIDIFYTRKGIVSRNEIDNIQGQGGIVVKAGSENVKITYNDIDHVQRGIVVGGWAGGDGSSWPAKMGWQAKNLHVEGNYVHNTTKFALLTQGAIDSTITKNAFLPNNTYYTVAATGADNNGWQSNNIKFTNNIVQRDKWLVDPGRDVTVNTGNVKAESFDENKIGSEGLAIGKGVLAVSGFGVETEVSFENMPDEKRADAKGFILVDSLGVNNSNIVGDASSDLWTIKAADDDLHISRSLDMPSSDHSIPLLGVGNSDALSVL